MSASEHNVSGYKIAVVLPCFNEVGTIGLVVSAFQQALPASQIYVFDNNSDDGSGEEEDALLDDLLREMG